MTATANASEKQQTHFDLVATSPVVASHVADKFFGKQHQYGLNRPQTLLCRVPVTVTTIYRDDNEVQAAKGGENLRLRLGGVDEDEVSPGFVLCSRHLPVPAVTYFDAQLHLLDLLEHKSLFSAGYKAILHIHAAVEECEITALLAQIDPKTKQKKKACLHAHGGMHGICRVVALCRVIACFGQRHVCLLGRLNKCRRSKQQD